MVKSAQSNTVVEWAFKSTGTYDNPFTQVTLNAVFTGPSGESYTVPAFWAGKNVWKVRFSAPEPGKYTFATACSKQGDAGLHGRIGAVNVSAYRGKNPLLKHGPLTVSNDNRHLQHRDGTPFLWLGDTWWLGASKRLKWPADFKRLTADRKRKGFNLVQMVVGMPPDMDAFDIRAENEGGYCWEPGFKSINPAYFDHADRKIAHLVDEGLLPCILGCWGYYLLKTGQPRMKRFFRYLIARYAAYPMVWCVSGEQIMPWYRTKKHQSDMQQQKEGWTGVTRYLRDTDPFKRLVTTHDLFMQDAREQVTDESVLDFNMFQASHGGYNSMTANTKTLLRTLKKRPHMPVINGETCYEGILGGSWEDIQRFLWWTNMLAGAAGYTYGANGIWSFEDNKGSFGASPHGGCWNTVPWQTAMNYPGSTQLGIARRFLMRYPWQRCRPHQDWVSPAGTPKNWKAPWSMGIPGELRIVYLPAIVTNWQPHPLVCKLEQGIAYRVTAMDPKCGAEYDMGPATGNKDGMWEIPLLPVMQDMVLILENENVIKNSPRRSASRRT